MTETVYMLGAGINWSIKHPLRDVRPPLARDFFQQLLKDDSPAKLQLLREESRSLYGYIDSVWGLSIQELKSGEFDLEKCYTRIQQDKRTQDMERWTELWQVESQLTALLGGFLAGFVPYGTPPDFGDEEPKRQSFLEFATQILQERATVLTFNYDTLLEQAIEAASGQRPTPESLQGDELLKIMQTPEETQRIVPEDLLSYSQANWNPLRAYGIEFDEVQIRSNPTLAPVPGERFYAAPGNTPYDFLFLKLHGSLNWYTYTGTSMLPNMTDVDPTKKDKTLHLANPWGDGWEQGRTLASNSSTGACSYCHKS